MLASEDAAGQRGTRPYSLASDIIELIVLTADEPFLQTLREAVGASRRLWHVPTPDTVSDLLVAGGVGILVLDAQALEPQALRGFIGHIERQFPGLVVIVAGTRESEATLASQISAGSVYRFIHKPMSPGRARLFADAAVRKFVEQARRTSSRSAAAPQAAASLKLWIGGACAALAVSILVVAARAPQALHAESAAPPSRAAAAVPAPSADVHDAMMARAENALRAQFARSREQHHAGAAVVPPPRPQPNAARPPQPAAANDPAQNGSTQNDAQVPVDRQTQPQL